MLALIAFVVLAPLLFVPGFLMERAIVGAAPSPNSLDSLYTRVVLGALLNGWLALTLAELGIFSLWLHLLILVNPCGAASFVAHQRGALNLPRASLGLVRGSTDNRQLAFSLRPSAFSLFVALGVLVIALVGRPFETVLGARDAGFYASTGIAIARHGGIVQHDAIVAQIGQDKQSSNSEIAAAAAQAETNFLSKQNEERFLLTGIRAAGFFFEREKLEEGRIIPQGFLLFPAWVGLLTSLLGPQGGLLATGLMGFLGVWSVGMLGRRLAGPWVGLLAALLLALNGVQVWFSRYSTTETTAQFLTFAGLYAFAAMQQSAERRAQSAEHGTLYAFVAGLAFGQWALVRVEFFLVIGPVLLFLLYVWLTRRWQQAYSVFALALGAMLVQAALHITFIARGYFFDTLFARLQDKSAIVAALSLPFLSDTLREIYLTTPRSLINYWAENPADRHGPLRLVVEILLVVVLVVGLFLLRRRQTPFRRFEQMLRRVSRPVLALVALAIVLASVYAYLVRPQILSLDVLRAAPSCFTPAKLRQPEGPCLALQSYIGAPIAPPEHPDVIAYWFDTLPKLLRQPKLNVFSETQAVQAGPLRDLPTLEGQPSPGLVIDELAAAETVQVLGRSADDLSYLVRSGRITGWVDAALLGLDPVITAQLPEQPDRVLANVVNPRNATSFSPGNPRESAKFAIYQASMVRFGWYLSPLGVMLAVAGLALFTRKLDRTNWLMLVVCGLATYVFLEQAYGTDEATYIYLLRRFVPQVYPLFCFGAAYALVAVGRRTKDEGRKPEMLAFVVRGSSFVVGLALVGFLVATNLKLYRHTEYQGALDQIGEVAASFEPKDVLLFRGGAPTWGAYRDISDNLSTPLTYAFERNALTIKSQNPGNYAEPLARYVRHWQEQGRKVYLVLSASGGLGLPGLRQEKVDTFTIALDEFEQLADQKPSNVQTLMADYNVYQLVPGEAADLPTAITSNDYAAQMHGFYRSELFENQLLAWTNGDALLRLPWPKGNKPFEVTVKLAPGKRPAALGSAQVALSYRLEHNFFVESSDAPPFSAPTRFTLEEKQNQLTLQIDPRRLPSPPTGTFLLRIESQPWVPARDQPGSNDARSLGVLFGGASIRTP